MTEKLAAKCPLVTLLSGGSPFDMQQYISDDSRPIEERIGYNPFEDEVLPMVITIKNLDPDFPNGFHVDIVEGLEIGSLLYIMEKDEIVRVRGIADMENERFLIFDRGFGETLISEITAGDRLIVVGLDDAKDLYPLMVQTIVKDGE